MKIPVRRDGADLVLQLRVQPRASKDALLVDDGRLRLRITAPPVDGAANAHLVRWLACTFGVANRHVEIIRGLSGREKTVRIIAPTIIPTAIEALLS